MNEMSEALPSLFSSFCCSSRKNMCNTDVNTTNTTIKTILRSTHLIIPVLRIHLKVTLHCASKGQVMK